MSSHWSLALLFELCLLIGWAHSYNNFIPPNMRADIMKLKAHFKTSDKSLFGNPLFPDDLKKFEESEQRLLLHEILDVYVAILSDMLNHTEDNDVRMSIEEIKHRVMDLRKKHFQNKEKALKKRLQDLWAMKTDDLTVQRKAIRELMPVYQKAAELGVRIQGRKEKRKKRQSAGKFTRP